MSVSAVVDEAGVPNTPDVLDSNRIVWEQSMSQKWWHNAHEKASQPLAFSNAAGRFSDPALPFKTLYFGSDSITCFWESGLGRNLNKRFLSDRTITVDDLRARIEYTVSLTPSGLRLLNADDSAARRSIGAHSIACFQANHVVSRQWAEALFSAGAHGILYSSARSDGVCLALFESTAAREALGPPVHVRCCYDNAPLLATLFRERVKLM
jgi:RES domain